MRQLGLMVVLGGAVLSSCTKENYNGGRIDLGNGRVVTVPDIPNCLLTPSYNFNLLEKFRGFFRPKVNFGRVSIPDVANCLLGYEIEPRKLEDYR